MTTAIRLIILEGEAEIGDGVGDEERTGDVPDEEREDGRFTSAASVA